jgi:hypothetical protein
MDVLPISNAFFASTMQEEDVLKAVFEWFQE